MFLEYALRLRHRTTKKSQPPGIGAKKSTQTFFVQSFSTTLRVTDVRAENRGRPQQKALFPAAPVVGRNFLTPGHPGVRVRNVRGKSGLKSLCLCCFSSLMERRESKKFLEYRKWETDFLPLPVLTRQGRSTGKTQCW